MRKNRGFTLVEIMIVVAIIALLAAIAIPNLLRARINANQSAAQGALRTVTSSMESLRSVNSAYVTTPGGAVLATLAFLGAPAAGPAYIDAALAAGTKQGYNFTLAVGADTQSYLSTAVPVTANVTGVASYCTTEDGVIHIQAAGGAIATAAACRALPQTG